MKRELATILHNPPFQRISEPRCNFEVQFLPRRRRGAWQSARLILPNAKLGQLLLELYGSPSSRRSLILGSTRVRFQRSRDTAPPGVVEWLRRTPYQDPFALAYELGPTEDDEWGSEEEEEDADVNVCTVQFGWWCRDHAFSPEWETPVCGTLAYDAERRELRFSGYITHTQVEDNTLTRGITIRPGQVAWVALAPPPAPPAILFSLHYPPSFESISSVGTFPDESPAREREQAFDDSHQPLAPYTSLTFRLVCCHDSDLHVFRDFAQQAHIRIASFSYDMEYRGLFSEAQRTLYSKWVKTLPWLVAFRVEALLRAWLVDMKELLSLHADIARCVKDHQAEYTAALLYELTTRLKTLHWYGEDELDRGDGVSRCMTPQDLDTVPRLFARVEEQFVFKPIHTTVPSNDATAPFHCLRLTVTPTTMSLHGPVPERSNRVMRRYYHNQHCFMRVTFQDENSLQYRFDRDVDGSYLISSRVTNLLCKGIMVAGRRFQFLAYSQSALKEHSVWFVAPFKHRNSNGDIEDVDASTVIASLGNFRNLPFDPWLMYCPARYAARIAQAFTATDASITIDVGQIIVGHDIKDSTGKYTFTDGVGTISPLLAQEFWRVLQGRCRQGRREKNYPRAFQIRLQGSKGMLSVDYTLPDRAIMLRPSMIKFEDPKSQTIDIVRAFNKPGKFYLNRPFIMLLDCLGVPYEIFRDLQDAAVRNVQESVNSLQTSARLLDAHGLGTSFRLSATMHALHKLGLPSLHEDTFWRQMMAFAMNHVLRELKYKARIPVVGPDSWALVGVADVHRVLQEGEVFVCVDSPEYGVQYLEGRIMVSRSPYIHPGDIQIVTAIGRPPTDSPFAKESLRNTIVFSVLGESYLRA